MNAIRLMTSRCMLLAAVGLAFFVSPAVAVDILMRSTGQLDFSADPVPADFFGPGSLPFEGVVSLAGVPSGPFGADTIISRGPVVGGVETVSIEIIALQLQSVAPIEVMFGSGPSSFFDLSVELNTGAPPQLVHWIYNKRRPAAVRSFKARLSATWILRLVGYWIS